jgi:hypothetical protein
MFARLELYLHHFNDCFLFQLKQRFDERIIVEGAMAFAEKCLMSFLISLEGGE